MDSAQQPLSSTIPILGDRRAPHTADTMTQLKQPWVAHLGDEDTQHVQDTALDVEPSNNQDCQRQAAIAGVCFGGCDPKDLFHPDGSSRLSQRDPCPSSDERIDGDSEYDGGDEDEGSDGGEEDGKSDVDDDHLKIDGIKKSDAKIPLPGSDSRGEFPTPGVCRGLMEYLHDRIDMKPLAGTFSKAEVTSTANNQARLQSGLKRASWEILKDEEVKEVDGRRAKRTKRGGYANGSARKPLAECQGNLQPSSKGEYKRQGSLAKASHRLNTRPAGSAVQKLHRDRLRRSAAKCTQKELLDFDSYPQADIVVYTHYYNGLNATGEPHSRPSSHRQRQAGSERTNAALNPEVGGPARETLHAIPHGDPEGNGSNESEKQPNPGEVTHNDVRSTPRQQYRLPAANTVRDDPFFSDELFNGMLNGQPDSNHIGNMYTRSHQREIDEYYQRVTGQRPVLELENNTLEKPMASSAQQQTIDNLASAPAHGSNAPLVAQAPTGALRLARASINDLDFGDIRDWNSAWSSFVNDHDSKPLMRGHYPDENK